MLDPLQALHAHVEATVGLVSQVAELHKLQSTNPFEATRVEAKLGAFAARVDYELASQRYLSIGPNTLDVYAYVRQCMMAVNEAANNFIVGLRPASPVRYRAYSKFECVNRAMAVGVSAGRTGFELDDRDLEPFARSAYIAGMLVGNLERHFDGVDSTV